MFTFLTIVAAVILISLLLVAGARPSRSQLSLFELKRRANSGDKVAKRELDREDVIADVLSLIRIKVAVLLVGFTILSILAFGWFFGITVSIIAAIFYGPIASLKPISKASQKLYKAFEPEILKATKKFSKIFKIIRQNSEVGLNEASIDSRQELQSLVESSDGVLSDDEKKLVISGLSFNDLTVSSIMTPKSVIDSIKKSEFLGPLTLDELHKTGHSRLPVIDGDIDHIVGILNLKSLLALDIKRSTTAEKAMDPKVYYVREDQTLRHALAAFLRTHHHLFVVVNEYRETVGLLALEDVIEALIGQKIIDEFDEHDDLRAVALDNINQNNEPKKGQDV